MVVLRRRQFLTNTAIIFLLATFLCVLHNMLAPKQPTSKRNQPRSFAQSKLGQILGISLDRTIWNKKSRSVRPRRGAEPFRRGLPRGVAGGGLRRYDNGHSQHKASRWTANKANTLGDMGNPVYISRVPSESEKQELKLGWKDHGFNTFVSDMISPHRTLNEHRTSRCLNSNWGSLPSASVVICFHNELWSALLRTVHSVMDRSPENTEIVLVDDKSTLHNLGDPLAAYIESYPLVKIVRNDKRRGLIHSRLAGAKRAGGNVLVFLDSHSEVANGWLEPLLHRISRHGEAVVCPVVDYINPQLFAYHHKPDSQILVTGFDWDLETVSMVVPERERALQRHPSDPIGTPIIPGGIFAIDRQFFKRIGSYDDGMEQEGGEQIELSFKTWMCGERVEIIPCSHVGLVGSRRTFFKPSPTYQLRNKIRIAETWMDHYKKTFYRVSGVAGDMPAFGDITSHKLIRDELKCRSFRWYLHHVYPEYTTPEDALASGVIRNDIANLCFDSPRELDSRNKPVTLRQCITPYGGPSQFWVLSKAGEIRREHFCLDFFGKGLVQELCHGQDGNQLWEYEQHLGYIRHASNTCITMGTTGLLEMAECTLDNPRQKWKFENYTASKLLYRD